MSFEQISDKFVAFVRYSAIAGFVATTSLVINLNHKAFGTIFKEKTRRFWWLFVIASIVILVLFLYIFNVIFGRLFLK